MAGTVTALPAHKGDNGWPGDRTAARASERASVQERSYSQDPSGGGDGQVTEIFQWGEILCTSAKIRLLAVKAN